MKRPCGELHYHTGPHGVHPLKWRDTWWRASSALSGAAALPTYACAHLLLVNHAATAVHCQLEAT